MLDNLIDYSINSSKTKLSAISKQIYISIDDIPSFRDNTIGKKEKISKLSIYYYMIYR